MTHLTNPEDETRLRASERLAGELPVQPSSLPSPSSEQPPASMTPAAEPIPADELPAASPLPDRGQRRSARHGGSLALLLLVLAIAGIAIVSTSKHTASDQHQPRDAAPVNR